MPVTSKAPCAPKGRQTIVDARYESIAPSSGKDYGVTTGLKVKSWTVTRSGQGFNSTSDILLRVILHKLAIDQLGGYVSRVMMIIPDSEDVRIVSCYHRSCLCEIRLCHDQLSLADPL